LTKQLVLGGPNGGYTKAIMNVADAGKAMIPQQKVDGSYEAPKLSVSQAGVELASGLGRGGVDIFEAGIGALSYGAMPETPEQEALVKGMKE
jgi:hypothetical protein